MAEGMSSSNPPEKYIQPSLVRGLSLLDSVLLLVGGIIGSGIFLTSGQVAEQVRRPSLFILVWIAGGLISLLACFAFAELGAIFPDAGGQYVYLREAYGEVPAFLYGWMTFAVTTTGSVAALAVGFSQYLGAVAPIAESSRVIFTVGGWAFTRGHFVSLLAIALITLVNVLGLRRGAVLQNAATWMKFGAIAIFVSLGLLIGKGSWTHYSGGMAMAPSSGSAVVAFGVALIGVFWAYDGWVYITYLAGEVQRPQRNLPLALVLGVSIVGIVYVSMNLVYLYALPLERLAQESTIAQAAAVTLFSPAAARWLSLMVAISCFGAMSSAIMSGARVYYAMARDGAFFQRMARVHSRWRTPAFSLMVQALWSAVLALSGKYDQLFTYVIFMMVLSYIATVAGLFVLRWKRPEAARPYRCTGYPVLPGLYVLLGGIWAMNAAFGRPREALAGMIILLLGVPGYVYWRRSARAVVPES